MSRHRTVIRLSAVLAAVALAKGCGDGDSPSAPPTPEPARPTTVTVSPATAELTALGTTVQLTAEVRDQNGQVMAGATVTWSSRDGAVATVDAGGLVTGVAEGVATITASAGSGQGMAEITVMDLDRAALVALYEATDGPNWVNSDNWLTDAPLQDWYGVDVDAYGRVVRLDLRGRYDDEDSNWIPHNLSGRIPPELGELTNLETLALTTNYLSGPIPPELGELANLTNLDLEFNQLSGPIPPEIGALANLVRLALGDNELSGPIPPELGNLANLATVGFQNNELSGPIPPELGNLANVSWFHLGNNELTGSIPQSFLQLGQLNSFFAASNELLCVPGTSAFTAWLQGIENQDARPEDSCNAIDVAVLKSLFDAAGGTGWIESDGWPGDGAVEEWFGVNADSLGRVTGLDLTRNGLAGQLPTNLGELVRLTQLRIGGNTLSGRLPLSMVQLPLREFYYADTELCVPTEEAFRAWLNAIPSHEGTGVECGPAILTHLSVDPPSLAPAEAGKQGRDTIYVTVTDAAGVPVADASYRWTTDRNSGWVFPAEGKTSPQGRISATWVAGWPGNGLLQLTVENPASALTTEIPTRSTASANRPSGQLYLNTHHEGTSAGYSIDITPLTEPPGTYYAAIQWDGGYAGLQRAGFRYDRQLQFSVWDAPGFGDAQVVEQGEGVICSPFGGEGTGFACELEYRWSVGSTYRFEVTEQEMNGGSAMTLHVTDIASGERRFVGTLRFARRARMRSSHMFVEDFRLRADHCLARELRSAAVRRTMALIDGAWQPITLGSLGIADTDSKNPGTPGCANVAGRSHPSGVEIVIGGDAVSDPNGSIQVTIPN